MIAQNHRAVRMVKIASAEWGATHMHDGFDLVTVRVEQSACSDSDDTGHFDSHCVDFWQGPQEKDSEFRN